MVAFRFRALTSKPLRLEMTSVHDKLAIYIEDYLEGILHEVRKYPPEPEGSKYERTYNLYDGWAVLGNNFDRTLSASSKRGSAVREYAQYVHGDSEGGSQLPKHVNTGWKNLYDHVDRGAYTAGIRAIYRQVRIQ